MRFLRALALALAFPLVFVAHGYATLAEEGVGQAVTLTEQGFSFVLPLGWEVQPVPEEAANDGVVFAAQRGDGYTQLFIQERPLGENEGIEALAAFSVQGENVSVGETIAAGGTEFLFSGEEFQDGEVTLVYRMATGVHEGRWVRFIWIDYAGDGAEVAKRMVRSFQSLLEKTDATDVVHP